MIEEPEVPPFAQRYGFAMGLAGVIAVIAAVLAGKAFFTKSAPPHQARQVTMVRILPSPPPPPPPPPRPPETRVMEQRVTEQPRMEDPDSKPDRKPPENPSATMGTHVKGDGTSDGFGLSAGGGGYFGGGGGAGGSGGSRWGWYAGEVQTTIADAVRRSPRTRNSNFRVEVRLWSDPAGRITRAGLGGTTGSLSLDHALTREVLVGLQLPEPPPVDMPMPIVLRVSARRPD